ncbi:FAD-dependent oxidoreductase [Nocardioides sp. AN3]
MGLPSNVGWDDDPLVAAWPGLPRLDGDLVADVCVVGLGGSGLAAVEECVHRGLSVVGVDAGRVAAGAAGRNGGLLLGGAAAFAHRAVETLGDAAAELYRATLGEIDRLAGQLGPEVIRRSGSIRLVGLPGVPRDEAEERDRELDAADCRDHAKAMRRLGITVEEYDGELGAGLYFPDDASMNPARRALGLAQRLQDRARLFEHSRVRSVSSGLVRTDAGSVSAPAVIVAVDGRLEQVLPQLAGRVRTARLQMLATAPGLPDRLPCPVYGRWGFDYAQQTADGALFVGGGRDRQPRTEWTADETPTAEIQGWIECVAERMAGRPVTVTRRWGASVGFTEDGRPLCAEVESGVFACGGYSGTGNLVGPLAARAALARAIDGATPPSYFAA